MIAGSSSHTQHGGLRIGQLAAELGTTTKTLRFYERIGLLQPPTRSDSGYRLYDSASIARARLVIGLRRLDLGIHELQDLLRDDPQTGLRLRLLALMDEKLRAIYLELGILQGRCDDLSIRHEALLSVPRDRPTTCVCAALFQVCSCLASVAGKGTQESREDLPKKRKKALTLPVQ